jgi:hypothetical protein
VQNDGTDLASSVGVRSRYDVDKLRMRSAMHEVDEQALDQRPTKLSEARREVGTFLVKTSHFTEIFTARICELREVGSPLAGQPSALTSLSDLQLSSPELL